MGKMSSTLIILAAVLFLLVFVSGIVLSLLGRPLNSGIFTVHKLVSIAAAGVIIYGIIQANKVTPLGTAEIAAIVVTALCFLGTVVVGVVLSFERPAPAIVKALHIILPVLTLISSGVTVYLLVGRR